MFYLVLVAVMLVSTTAAIVEHSKAETVERMKGKPPVQMGAGVQTQDYLIAGFNLTSRPSYLVTESGQKLTIIWVMPTVGYVEGNPTLSPLDLKGAWKKVTVIYAIDGEEIIGATI